MKLIDIIKTILVIKLTGFFIMGTAAAYIAYPYVYDEIEDAQVSEIINQISLIKKAAIKFHEDTGYYPVMQSNKENRFYHSFLYADSYNTNNEIIPGWNGPYLDHEPEHPISKDSLQYLQHTEHKSYVCDIDGNGMTEGSWLVYRLDDIPPTAMRKVSDVIDGDGISENWARKGMVKQYNGKHNSIMIVCLLRT